MKSIIKYIIILPLLLITGPQSAKEILIYADSISYDSDKNIIAQGKVKIISIDEIITSELVIINEEEKRIILPKKFQFKDSLNNYYYGSSGEFNSNMEDATINDFKLLLNDGSRIVGKEAIKKGEIDLINKGVYSPCISRINIKNFICPIWQLEGEKILHDRKNLFLHQKHSKMRILNVPVFYFPYVVSPSPLRKERKSGFLLPTINFNFLDTKTSQSTSIPYYFAISEDKELLFTPTINYGGGVDASQKLNFDYNQLVSGGNLDFDITFDTNLENQNSESWVRDASIITNYKKNINEHYNINFDSAFQSSPTFLRRNDQDELINRNNSLKTSFDINGFDLAEKGDNLNFKVSGYQVVKNNEDNKTAPVILPYLKYSTSVNKFNETNYTNKFNFYNIFRDISTTDHAQQQQRISHVLLTDYETFSFNSKINFKTEFHTQAYNIENKKIDNVDRNNQYYRIFPMSGLFIETPMKNNKYNFFLTPKISIIINSPQSNSNKISNEESTNNIFNLLNATNLNRYTGSDKLDNSQRVNYGFNITKDIINFEILQSYEFNNKNNYSNEIGNQDYLSDTVGTLMINNQNNDFSYNFRFNNDQRKINNQIINYTNNNFIGKSSIEYIQERKETNSILVDGSENINFKFDSSRFLKFSQINLISKFDLIKDNPSNYKVGYNYFDECFGINVDFERSFYEDRDLKPQDILTIMFSFKHLGSYKSSNLAVSETDKTEIRWKSGNIDDELFN